MKYGICLVKIIIKIKPQQNIEWRNKYLMDTLSEFLKGIPLKYEQQRKILNIR